MRKILVITLCLSVMLASSIFAMDTKGLKEGYALNKKYCVSCHDSVADPEKSGFTRDTWHLILNVMHKQGLQKLSNDDSEKLIDYFYSIRKGMELNAG